MLTKAPSWQGNPGNFTEWGSRELPKTYWTDYVLQLGALLTELEEVLMKKEVWLSLFRVLRLPTRSRLAGRDFSNKAYLAAICQKRKSWRMLQKEKVSWTSTLYYTRYEISCINKDWFDLILPPPRQQNLRCYFTGTAYTLCMHVGEGSHQGDISNLNLKTSYVKCFTTNLSGFVSLDVLGWVSVESKEFVPITEKILGCKFFWEPIFFPHFPFFFFFFSSFKPLIASLS